MAIKIVTADGREGNADPEHVAAVRAYNRAVQSYNALGRLLTTATGATRAALQVEFDRAKAQVAEAARHPRLER